MAEIDVSLLDQGDESYVFEVTVAERGSSTMHRVELTEGDYQNLTDGAISPALLVEKSFEFLLEREPKESILKEFNLMEIARYFPEYEEEIKERI